MAEAQNTEAFHQEIAALEAKLAAKKQELMNSGVESSEKAVFKQVVREHATPSEKPSVQLPVATATAASSPSRTTTPDEERKLNLLIAHAFTKGLAAAISEAQKTGDPFFIDTLHDRLADEYYQKLLTARKIKA
jgi:hypothetical protein